MSGSEPTLGNITKFSSHGEFLERYGATALRFYLLGIVRDLLPDERVKICWRYPLPARKQIEIIYSDERHSARTNGTMKCGSGWVCPVCMRYIAERRRLELETAMDRSADSLFSVMVTYTVQHNPGMRLKPLLAEMLRAYNGVFSGRWWSTIKEEYMVVGAVRATEITYGKNGWHPHFHVLMFSDRKMLDDGFATSPGDFSTSLYNQISPRWGYMLEKRGLSASAAVGVDVRTSDRQIAEYIAKFGRMPLEWSLNASAYEVSYSTAKTPQNGNFGVLDIIFHAAHSRDYQRLFLEYHAATKGRSQLHWSKGLKTLLDIEIVRDEIAAQGIETETDRLLAEIGTSLWRFIADRGYLGQVMTYANEGDEIKVLHLLERLQAQYDEIFQPLPQFDLGL
jgi:hypothetical protein